MDKVLSNERVEIECGVETIMVVRYLVDGHKSRGEKIQQRPKIRCEREGCTRTAVDLHHIEKSYRGKRQHLPDGSDMIFLCRVHHNVAHDNNNKSMRDGLKQRVRNILDNIKKGR